MNYDIEPLKLPSSSYFKLCETIKKSIEDFDASEHDFLVEDTKTKLLIDDAEKQLVIEVEKLNKKEEYYFGCPIEYYNKSYPERKDSFLEIFTDATEIDFIEAELKKGISNIPYLYCDLKLRQNFTYSLQRRLESLKDIAKELGFSIEVSIDEYDPNYYEGSLIRDSWVEENHKIVPIDNKNKKSIKYTGTQTQLIELVKSLIENGSINGTQKEIIKDFSEFFGMEVNNPDKLIQDLKKRNNGSETLFLDDLRKSLTQFISKENIR